MRHPTALAWGISEGAKVSVCCQDHWAFALCCEENPGEWSWSTQQGTLQTPKGSRIQSGSESRNSMARLQNKILLNFLEKFNSVQTVCIVKARLRKVHFSGVFDFLRCACSLGIRARDPLSSIKSPIFTNAPCKLTCLYNAPSAAVECTQCARAHTHTQCQKVTLTLSKKGSAKASANNNLFHNEIWQSGNDKRPGNQGFKKSAEIGRHQSSAHRNIVKQVFWVLSYP